MAVRLSAHATYVCCIHVHMHLYEPYVCRDMKATDALKPLQNPCHYLGILFWRILKRRHTAVCTSLSLIALEICRYMRIYTNVHI